MSFVKTPGMHAGLAGRMREDDGISPLAEVWIGEQVRFKRPERGLNH